MVAISRRFATNMSLHVQDLIADHASGSWVWTIGGKKVLDFGCGEASQTALGCTVGFAWTSCGALLGRRASEPYILRRAAGIGTLSLGHCHPNLTRAISDQAAKLIQGQQNQYLTNTAQACCAD